MAGQVDERATKTIIMIADAIIEAVKAGGGAGAPDGTLYLAMAAFGFPRGTFDAFMDALVTAGSLRKQGDLYFVAEVQ